MQLILKDSNPGFCPRLNEYLGSCDKNSRQDEALLLEPETAELRNSELPDRWDEAWKRTDIFVHARPTI